MNLARSCSTISGISSVRTVAYASRDLRELRDIRLVVSAANAAEPFIGPEHLCRDAVVFDIAVPMNTRPETETTTSRCTRHPGGNRQTALTGERTSA